MTTALLLLVACGGSDAAETSPTTLAGVETFTIDGNDHVDTDVVYPQSPPVGGNHSARWQTCGFYTEPVKNENAVHSLEHGAVWITFDPGLPADEITKLGALAKGQSHVLVSPYPGNPAPVVASAWGLQMKFGRSVDPGIAAFVKAYQNGPQTPEPGATCAKGVGTPE